MNENLPTGDPRSPERADAGSLLPFVLAAMVVIVVGYGGWKWWQVSEAQAARARAIPAATLTIPLADFELTERSGEPFRSADMRGKVWVASYFFSACPGTCLIVNRNIAMLNEHPDLEDVAWVSITCDPDNDTVERLREYADGFRADPKRWLFCRGDLEYVKGVARGMKLSLGLKTHTDHAVLIDKTGTIRGLFDATSKYECSRLAELARQCLDEEAPGNVVAAE
jgi:protein SCO1/2